MNHRRVVVTGLGCVSPVGNTVADSWANVLAGTPGIDLVTHFDASNLACQFAGEVKGFNIASGIGGLPLIEQMHSELVNRGPRRISPFFVPATIINMISGHVSIKFGLKGPNLAIVSACTTGLHSIGTAGRMI